MPVYHYQSVTGAGKKLKGFIDAASPQEAKEKLREQGVLVLRLASQGPRLFQFKKKGELRGATLVTFTTQLVGLLSAGVPLYESLISLEEQYKEEKFHGILLSLCEQIKGGTSLSAAMEHHPDSFNRLYCALVAAGESIGQLDTVLVKLATLLAKQHKLRKQIFTALLYPLLLAGFSCLVVTLLLTFVIPSLEALFADRDVNRFTSVVLSFSSFIRHMWPFYLPLLGATIGGAIYAWRRPGFRLWLHKRSLRIPLLKTLRTHTALARFCRTMGTLLEGGVPIIDALQIARKVMHNPILEQVIEEAEGKIIQGSLLSQELKQSEWIPKLVPRMLAIGEDGGSTPEMLHKIADLYDDEVEKSLARLMALAQPVLLLVMGGVIGLIMLAVLLPLTDVSAFI